MYRESYSEGRATVAIPSPIDQDVTAEAVAGLSRRQKTLPPKLFYDDEGCRLFQRITELPEYYLTRTERILLLDIAPAVAAMTPSGTALVEYGASDESKAEILLRQGNDAARTFAAYVPIDIAAEGLDEIPPRLKRSLPHVQVHTVVADFFRPLVLPHGLGNRPRLGFFPGSTIGNCDPAAAVGLLAQIRETLGRGARLLIGVDLRKDADILLPAYNDAAGVTAAFNRNVLVRLNREAHADFDVNAFAHNAIWNAAESRIEMHLVSLQRQVAHIGGMTVAFDRGETIHTENSYKHTVDGFKNLAALSGWSMRETWSDPDSRFSLHLLEAMGAYTT